MTSVNPNIPDQVKEPWYIRLLPWFVVAVALGAAIYLVNVYTDVFSQFYPAVLTETELQDSKLVTDRRGEFGTLGDAFGGLLNPLFTFLTMIMLLLTIRQTQKTNKIAFDNLVVTGMQVKQTNLAIQQTQEALKQSKEAIDQAGEMLEATKEQVRLSVLEMELTRKELAGSTKAQEDIAETQELQRFESTFYIMLGRFDKLQKDLYIKTGNSDEKEYLSDTLHEFQRSVSQESNDHMLIKKNHRKIISYLKYLTVFLKATSHEGRSSDFTEIIKMHLSGSELRVILFWGYALKTESFMDDLKFHVRSLSILEDESLVHDVIHSDIVYDNPMFQLY